jgi:hypothetical protein
MIKLTIFCKNAISIQEKRGKTQQIEIQMIKNYTIFTSKNF